MSSQVDVGDLAEALRKLTKRVDELEQEKKSLVKKGGEYEKELTTLRNRSNELYSKADAAEKRASDLESKIKAADHNSLARLSNSRLANPNHPLTPLKDVTQNLPIAKFPKHEKDVRVMSALEVSTVLRALDAPTSGSTGEQKTRLKELIGLSSIVPASATSTPPKPTVNGASPPETKTETTDFAAPTTVPKQPRPLQPKRTMSMEERKAAGIKAARERAANDRKLGGRPTPARSKKAVETDGGAPAPKASSVAFSTAPPSAPSVIGSKAPTTAPTTAGSIPSKAPSKVGTLDGIKE